MFIFLWHAFDNESIQNAKDLKSQSRPCECMKRRLKVQWNWWNDAPVTVWRRLTMTKVMNERNENPFQWNQLYQSARFRLCLIVIANFNPIYLGTTSAKIQLLLFSSRWTYFPTKNFWNYRDSIHERITSRLFILNWLYSIESQLLRNFSPWTIQNLHVGWDQLRNTFQEGWFISILPIHRNRVWRLHRKIVS